MVPGSVRCTFSPVGQVCADRDRRGAREGGALRPFPGRERADRRCRVPVRCVLALPGRIVLIDWPGSVACGVSACSGRIVLIGIARCRRARVPAVPGREGADRQGWARTGAVVGTPPTHAARGVAGGNLRAPAGTAFRSRARAACSSRRVTPSRSGSAPRSSSSGSIVATFRKCATAPGESASRAPSASHLRSAWLCAATSATAVTTAAAHRPAAPSEAPSDSRVNSRR
ncbi:hypothetical protein HBB16_01600 [Pseudonocardia sp. MCCB 268]|nr:hypothetical protein [Pseudonocardia cytotoxica]